MKLEKNDLETSVVDIAAYDEWIRSGVMRLFSLRALIVSLLYFLGCLMFDKGVWTSLLIMTSIYLIHVAAVGRRHIERFGLLFFGVAAAWWIDIVPIKKYAFIAEIKLDQFLQVPASK